VNSNSTATVERCCFSPDKSRAHELCVSAKELIAVDPLAAAEKLIDALRQEASNMLAYHLLAELYQSEGKSEEASMCRRSMLPPEAVHLLGPTLCQPVGELVSTADENTVDRKMLYSDDTVELPPPGRVQGDQSELPRLFSELSIESKPCFIDCIDGGVLWHDSFHTRVFNSWHQEVAEHSKADLPLINALMNEYEPCHIEGRVFVIGARGAHNFYHWMLDIAPKLCVLLKAGYKFSPTDRFIVPFANADFTWQIMALFGLAREQVYESEKQHTYISADELIVPFVDNKMGLTMGRWVPAILRNHFLQHTEATSEVVGRRLFITRESGASDGRQIVNQNELLKMLQQNGFTCVQPEKLTVVEQAGLFANADTIVAAHGAALANIVFCKPGTEIVEFYSGHLAPCYWAISALTNLQYTHLYCGQNNGSGDRVGRESAARGSAASGSAASGSAARSGNLTVPLALVDSLLKSG